MCGRLYPLKYTMEVTKLNQDYVAMIMFHDPLSLRMKLTRILYHGGRASYNFRHWDRDYISSDYYYEPDYIWSRDGKLIGIGHPFPDLAPYLRPACNARNAVVGGRPNALHPNRDVFAELMAIDRKREQERSLFWKRRQGETITLEIDCDKLRKDPYQPSGSEIYWYLTESWEEFQERLWDGGLHPDYPTDGAMDPIGSPFVWEGYSANGEPEGDCIFEISEGMSLGFELETKNVPQWYDALAP